MEQLHPRKKPVNCAGTIFRPQVIGKHSAIAHAATLSLDAGLSDREAKQTLLRSRAIAALERARGNICRAAGILEIHRNTLTRRLDELNLSRLPGELRRQNSLQLALDFRAGRAAEAPSAPKKPAGKPVRSEKRRLSSSERAGRPRGKLWA